MTADPTFYAVQMTAAGRSLSTDDLVQACMMVAVRRAQEGALDRDALHTSLDEVILGQAPGLHGAIDALPAVRAALRSSRRRSAADESSFVSIGDAAAAVVQRLRDRDGGKQ